MILILFMSQEAPSVACPIVDTSRDLMIESAVIEGMLQETIGEGCRLYHGKVRFLQFFVPVVVLMCSSNQGLPVARRRPYRHRYTQRQLWMLGDG